MIYRFLISAILCFTAFISFGQRDAQPIFSEAVYQGMDEVYDKYPLESDEFYNPIIQGCYPDPSITKKGDDYYLVASSFVMFPGVPIFHSKDLVNWQQIGHVLESKTQLRVENLGISRGVYAPSIRYNPHNDYFYMITTQVDGTLGNMVVKTKDPHKGWSEPHILNFNGIDPSLFFDKNGKAYVVHNDAPDPGKTLYRGHRVIKIWEYDLENDQVIAGTDEIIVDGGVDITEEPIWIEAPHIYQRHGKYYLMCAEGGTGDWHSEVIFVSDHPKGPYTPATNNPILSQRYLHPDRDNKVDWAGHADLVVGPDDKYYGVFLAVRPNEENRVNTGREIFILPVDWSGEFPVFENGLVPFDPKLKMPEGVINRTQDPKYFPNGNFSYVEDFTSSDLDHRWIGLRSPREDFIRQSAKGLHIQPYPANIKETAPTSTLYYRQQHRSFSFSTTMSYHPTKSNELAGITCLQNEHSNYLLGITHQEGQDYIVLQRTESPNPGESPNSTLLASEKININGTIKLKVEAKGDKYQFSYAVNGDTYKHIGDIVSGDILSTDVAGGFTGAMIGLHATLANDIKVNME